MDKKKQLAATAITKFEKSNLDAIRAVISDAVNNALAPYGLTGKLGKITYDETNFTAKLEVATSSNGEAMYRRLVGLEMGKLKNEWFGQAFDLKGHKYRVIGADLDRSKYPVLIQRVSDGEVSGFTVDGLRSKFDTERLDADRRKEYATNLTNLKPFKDVPRAAEYLAVLKNPDALIGVELTGGGKIVGLLKDAFAVPPLKNKIVIERDGKFYTMAIAGAATMLPNAA